MGTLLPPNWSLTKTSWHWLKTKFNSLAPEKRQPDSGRPKGTIETEDNPIQTITQRKCRRANYVLDFFYLDKLKVRKKT